MYCTNSQADATSLGIFLTVLSLFRPMTECAVSELSGCGLRMGGRSSMGGAWLESSRPSGHNGTPLMVLGPAPRDLDPTLSPLALGPKCGIDEFSSISWVRRYIGWGLGITGSSPSQNWYILPIGYMKFLNIFINSILSNSFYSYNI